MNQEFNSTRNVSVIGIRTSDTDGDVIKKWLHNKSKHTKEAYYTDVKQFLNFFDHKRLSQVTVDDLQAFEESLSNLSPASRYRKLAAIKSLLSFGQKIGYLPVNVGAAMRLRKPKDTLDDRILSEVDVLRMIAFEPNQRNRVLLALFYVSGIRVSELCNLTWRDVQPNGNAGQIIIRGKKGESRAIPLPSIVWTELASIQKSSELKDPVFRSRKSGKKLNRSQVFRIVRVAAKRAGISKNVSCYWLRHAHAFHALDRGASIHLVQKTLGHSSIQATGRYLRNISDDSSSLYLKI